VDSDIVAVVIVFNLVIAYVLERYDEQVEFSLARLESEFGEDQVERAREIFRTYSRADDEVSGGQEVVAVRLICLG